MTDENIAVVHKHFTEDGGAERVAVELARIFEAPLYVGHSNSDVVNKVDVEIVDLFDDSLVHTVARRSGLTRELYHLDAWEYQPELTEYDILIQTAPQPGWYIPAEEQTIIRYVHDLPRTVYDQFQYQNQTAFSRLFARIYRVLHATSAKFVDDWVVNSDYIRQRLSQYLDINNATVVHPPVDVSRYYYHSSDDFYLIYSRLSERKRVHDVVTEFKRLPDQNLIVGGTGPLADEVKKQARNLTNVEYRGYLSEDEKIDLLSRAKAVIFGADTESFGIVPVEAFASGTPVIGTASGNTQNHIVHGKNGLLFSWKGEGISETVKKFEEEGVEYGPQSIIEDAQQYSRSRFKDKMTTIVRGQESLYSKN